MQHTWTENNNNKLIVFFNGWGCDKHQFAHLKSGDFDILMFNDYRDLTLCRDDIDKVKSYDEVYIIAWSYGVWVAQLLWEKYQLPKSKAIAVNGTTLPVSEEYGIPGTIMQGTLDNLNERNLTKFQRRMVGGSERWKKFEAVKPQRCFEEQREELAALIQHFKYGELKGGFYDNAVIGSNDLIFVAGNQLKFWSNKVKIKQIEAAHYCFFEISSWEELLG